MFSSLQSKLIAAMSFLVAASVMAAVVLSGVLLLTTHKESVRQQLQSTGASLMSLGITDFSELADFEKFSLFIEQTLQMERVETVIRIHDQSKNLIFTTVGAHDILPKTLTQKIEKPTFLTLAEGGRTYESLVMPYEARGKPFYLQIAIPLPPYSTILESFWWQALLLFAVLLTISFFLSRRLATRLLTPVRVISEHLQHLDPHHIEQWQTLSPGITGEYLGPIAHGINLLVQKAQAAAFRLQKMTRYVAHELRTPLTILRGEAERALIKKTISAEDYAEILKSSLEEIDRMSDIVTTTLRVGDHEETKRQFTLETVRLGPWLEERMSLWEKALGRPLSSDGLAEKKCTVSIEPALFSRLLDNLFRNVGQHTPPSTPCQLILQTTSSSSALHVVDAGPGLSPELLRALNNGSGEPTESIGLHLCQRIAEICRCRLAFSNEPRGGLRVTILFTENDQVYPA